MCDQTMDIPIMGEEFILISSTQTQLSSAVIKQDTGVCTTNSHVKVLQPELEEEKALTQDDDEEAMGCRKNNTTYELILEMVVERICFIFPS